LGTKELAVASLTYFLTTNVFIRNNMTVVHNPPYFSPFSLLKTKMKGRHFDIIVVIEAESQAVLITLKEHTCIINLKHGRRAENGAHARKGTASTFMVAYKPEVNC
jgi:hypothetical protein